MGVGEVDGAGQGGAGWAVMGVGRAGWGRAGEEGMWWVVEGRAELSFKVLESF